MPLPTNPVTRAAASVTPPRPGAVSVVVSRCGFAATPLAVRTAPRGPSARTTQPPSWVTMPPCDATARKRPALPTPGCRYVGSNAMNPFPSPDDSVAVPDAPVALSRTSIRDPPRLVATKRPSPSSDPENHSATDAPSQRYAVALPSLVATPTKRFGFDVRPTNEPW